MRLRLLNINTWHALSFRPGFRTEIVQTPEERELRAQALVQGIRELEPDVVTLQECFPQPAFARRVASALSFQVASCVMNAGVRVLGVGVPVGLLSGEGLAILSRPGLRMRPLGARSLSGIGLVGPRLSLQITPRQMALSCALDCGGRPIRVVTGHLRYEWATLEGFRSGWSALRERGAVQDLPAPGLLREVSANIAARDAELAALAGFVEEHQARAPTVLAGDLNLDDDAPQLARFCKRVSMESALAARGDSRCTWDPDRNPNTRASTDLRHVDGTLRDLRARVAAYHDQLPQRPDHVLVEQGPLWLHLVDARVVLDSPRGGILPSDHYGILADFEVR
jgi:endonuclease/exonuclease/phosphatase family metal-dependent hydrolase